MRLQPFLLCGFVLGQIVAALPVMAADVPVRLVNKTEPTLCAEKDNVTVELASPRVRSFRIDARHPNYIGGLSVDRSSADWHNCTGFPADPEYAFSPRRVTLYETASWQIVGYTFAKFWRVNSPPITVGTQVFRDIHLIQVWTRVDDRAEEILVLYPGDGYWRARPLPPKHLAWSAYGSSFLVGPVEVQGRPIVDVAALRIDPENLTFHMSFARGGTGWLRLSYLDRDIISLDTSLDKAVAGGGVFAALRSMYVSDINNDAARIGWREPGAEVWREGGMLDVKQVDAAEVWIGRTVHSRHNTSAPDMIFGDFRDDGSVRGSGPAKPAAN